MTTVFMDARTAVRGLGIASAVDRLELELARRADCTVTVNRSAHGWTARGKLDTVLRTGLVDLDPRLDPRSRRAEAAHYFGNTCPARPSPRTIVTVHDVMALGSRGTKGRVLEALLVPGLTRRRATVVAISCRTADSLVTELGLPARDIEVIPHGYRDLPVWTGPRTHVLMLGGSGDARKRVDLGIRAYVQYASRAGDDALPLVIAGRAGLSPEHLALTAGHAVRVEHDPARATLDHLLGRAACLLYPSAREGYGLPILEAGEVGTPVVYDQGADIPQEPLGRHAVPARAASPDAFASSLAAAVAAGPVHDALSGRPTWADVAARYAELYRAVAS